MQSAITDPPSGSTIDPDEEEVVVRGYAWSGRCRSWCFWSLLKRNPWIFEQRPLAPSFAASDVDNGAGCQSRGCWLHPVHKSTAERDTHSV